MRLSEECLTRRCGNVAAILELDEHLSKNFKVCAHAPACMEMQRAGLQGFPLTELGHVQPYRQPVLTERGAVLPL